MRPAAFAPEHFILGRTGTAMGWLYDAIGRPRLLVDDLPNGAGTTWTFAHNPASQIVSATRTNDAYAWTGHYPVNRAYTANGLNQYRAAGGASFAYDANGNLTWDGARTYAYDIENRLVGTSSGLALTYDPLGRLYQSSGGASGTTRFLHDGDDLVAEYNAAGALLRRYVHGPGADEPLLWYEGAAVAQANRRHFVADAQGSIVAITDAIGNRLAINAYDEYGIPAATNSGRFQYTGQIWLPDLGMYHYKARVYSPTLGRFLQTDPVGYDDQFNLYAYVGDDPINHTDPAGMQMAPDPRQPIVEAVGDFLVGDIVNAVNDPSAWNIGVAIVTIAPPGRMVGGLAKVGRFLRRLTRPAQRLEPATRGAANGERAGRPFTQRGREVIDRRNAERHGRPTCEDCRQEVVPGQRHERGVTPPGNERQRDHYIPRSHGGDGTPENGQVLCRDCNLRKRDRMPE